MVPLPGPNGGAVVAHAETTEVKRAEIDAQRIRQELAHSARVFTMGELTASLAHELNQPLAGIRTNAQAAQRFLDATPPDYSEIRTILWATGYRPDYSWLKVPVLDRKGRMRHDGGVTPAGGLYVMGLQFLRRRKSAFRG